jgi:hypothetical protein
LAVTLLDITKLIIRLACLLSSEQLSLQQLQDKLKLDKLGCRVMLRCAVDKGTMHVGIMHVNIHIW